MFNIMFKTFVHIFVQIISGIQLPPSNYSSTNKADVTVIIEIFGVPYDQVKQQTHVIKRNGELLINFVISTSCCKT